MLVNTARTNDAVGKLVPKAATKLNATFYNHYEIEWFIFFTVYINK